jgi:hypothetical protein
MTKPTETLDDMFETEAQARREQARRDDDDPALQAKLAAKLKREQEAADAGRTVYTAEEIAAHEAEAEADEDDDA